MGLFPPSTNDAYRGSPIAAWCLAVLAAGSIAPGLIHQLLPDGGAGVIAGLDLSRDGALIIALFAWAGATQTAWGLLLAAIAWRYRSLVPLGLCLALLERGMHVANMWMLKPRPGALHPPEAYAALVALPLIVVMLALSLRDAKRPSSSTRS